MPYQSLFSNKPQTQAQSAKGGYTSLFGLATDNLVKSEPQQKQRDQKNAQTQASQPKQQPVQQQPKQSLFGKVKSTAKQMATDAVHIGEKSANTVAALTGTVAGTTVGAGQMLTGHKQAGQKTLNTTDKIGNAILDKGLGGQGGYINSKQANSSGGGKKGFTDNFVKPVVKASTDIAPFVVPGAKGGSLLSKVARDATANAIVGAGGTAAQEKLNGQKLNAKEIAKGGATNAAFAVAAHGATAAVKHGTGKIASSDTVGTVKAALGKDQATNSLIARAKINSIPESVLQDHVAEKSVPRPGDVITPDTQRSLDTIMSKVKPTAKLVREQADATEQTKLANEQSVKVQQEADKAVTDTKKIDDKIELINAKKADDKFTNVDKTKVSQLEAQKAELAPAIKQAETPQAEALPTATHNITVFGKTIPMTEENGFKASPTKDGGIVYEKTAMRGNNAKGDRQAITRYYTSDGKNITQAQHGAMVDGSLSTPKTVADAATTPEAKSVSEATPVPQPKAIETTAKPSESSSAKGSTSESKTADTDNASRVYKRLQAEHPDQLKEDVSYDKMNMQQDAQKAVDLLKKDPQQAYEVAMGEKPVTGQTNTAVNIAMAEKALDEGNYDLYAKLTKSRSLEQTRRGQELVAEKGSVTDNSTARYVKELLATRLDNAGKKFLSGIDMTGRKVGTKERATIAIDNGVKQLDRQIRNKKLDTKTALAMLDRLECL